MEEDTFLNASATNKDGFAGDRRYLIPNDLIMTQ